MSTLKINKHADVPTALDLVKEEVGKEAKMGYVKRVAKALKVKLAVKAC